MLHRSGDESPKDASPGQSNRSERRPGSIYQQIEQAPLNKAISSAVAATFLLLSGCAGRQYAAIASESHFVSFGTNHVHYLIEGTGSHTIVFVHCWAGNASFWREQVPELAGHARLILVDLPGHGQSDKPHVEYTMDFFASAVLAVLRDARVDKATLVGHSMGVPIICRLYKQAPEKVAALVAVDGTLRRPPMTPDQAEQFPAERFHLGPRHDLVHLQQLAQHAADGQAGVQRGVRILEHHLHAAAQLA